MTNGARSNLVLRCLSRAQSRGWIQLGDRALPCAIGRTGQTARKREGDGCSPIGVWRPIAVLYRADRVPRPRTMLPVRMLKATDGWCDAVGDRNYNRAVRHPYPASAEQLWRTDHLYDIVVVLDHNRRPRIQGGGSAIFMHLARHGYSPTEGCIAFAPNDMLQILEAANGRTKLRVSR